MRQAANRAAFSFNSQTRFHFYNQQNSMIKITKSLKQASLFVLFATGITPLFAQKYSNEFLNIGTGARAQGMGNAHVAITDDVTAAYWNPAGIANFQGQLQVGLQHAEVFAGVSKYDYLAAIYPLQDSTRTVGLSIIRFGVDNIPNTLSLFSADGTPQYNNVTSFSASDYAFLFTYAQKTGIEGLSLGGNAKIIYRTVGQFARAWGFGLDAGLQYRKNNWRFGASLRDITGTYNAWSFSFNPEEKKILAGVNGTDAIPISSVEVTRPKITLGAGYQQRFGSFGVTGDVDFNITTDGRRNTLISAAPFSIDPAAGVELDYKQLVFLRGGFNNFQRFTDINNRQVAAFQPNIGVGLKVFGVRLDYAFTNVGDTQRNTYSHVVSLVADINTAYLKTAFKEEE